MMQMERRGIVAHPYSPDAAESPRQNPAVGINAVDAVTRKR
jgi:hypothetical protein